MVSNEYGKLVWVPWPSDDPEKLARYVSAETVGKFIQVFSGESIISRLRLVWKQLRSVGISWVPEKNFSAASGQWIRSPDELLDGCKAGTCLDIACVLVGALLWNKIDAGILLLNPSSGYQGGHALVTASLTPSSHSLNALSPKCFPEIGEAIPLFQWDLEGPARDIMVLDPSILTSRRVPLGEDSLQAAVTSARGWLIDKGHTWHTHVVVKRDHETYASPVAIPFHPLRQDATLASGDTAWSYLLTAGLHVTEFMGRDTESSDLINWLESEHRVGIARLTGKAGVGKTRLAMKVIEEALERGWNAGIVVTSREEWEKKIAEQLEIGRPTLAVIDYADAHRRALQLLMEDIATRASKPQAKLRIILAARTDGDWWNRVSPFVYNIPNRGNLALVQLQPISRNLDVRSKIYTAAAEALKDEFRRRGQQLAEMDEKSPSDLLSDRFDTHLGIHIDALNRLLSSLDEAPECAIGVDPLEALVSHQERYWVRLLEADDLDVDIELDHVKYALTIVQILNPFTCDEATSLLAQLFGEWDLKTRRRFVGLLIRLYPPRTTECWDWLEPDVLGDFVSWKVLQERPEWWRGQILNLKGAKLSACLAVIRRISSQRQLPEPIVEMLSTLMPGRILFKPRARVPSLQSSNLSSWTSVLVAENQHINRLSDNARSGAAGKSIVPDRPVK